MKAWSDSLLRATFISGLGIIESPTVCLQTSVQYKMSVNPTREEKLMAYFGTIPNEDLPIICLSFFAAIGVVNLIITCQTRAWWMLLVPFTAFCEAAGYAAKIMMIHDPNFNIYVMMQCLLIIPPVSLLHHAKVWLFLLAECLLTAMLCLTVSLMNIKCMDVQDLQVFLAAAVYWAFGKIMHLGCPKDLDSFVKPKRIAVVLMCSDVLTLSIQALGAATLSAALKYFNLHQERKGQASWLKEIEYCILSGIVYDDTLITHRDVT